MREIETIPCRCPKGSCYMCEGSGQVPLQITGAYLWADGKWRDEMPPSELPIEVTEAINEAPAIIAVVHPEVPRDFGHTPRTLLRTSALDFALRAARQMGVKATGADILKEAEAIERWIANAQ